MSNYKHGAYGVIGETMASSARQVTTDACYVGVAPVHLVRGYASKGLVNQPIKLTTHRQAVETIGKAANWDTYTLSEVLAAHFDNPLGNVGPVYVINVLDPDTMRKAQAETRVLNFVNGRAEFVSDDIILDTFAVSDRAEGVDYTLDYNYTSGKVIITALGDMGNVSATYNVVDPAKVEDAHIVGGVTAAGEYSGCGALELLDNQHGTSAALLAAPGYSHKPAVYAALVSACQALNGHWYAFAVTDLPLDGNDTIAKAVVAKASGGFNSQYSAVCYPAVQDAQGRVFHLSTLSIWAQMAANETHRGIPFETASNKQIPAVKLYFGEGVRNAGYDKERANELNENGIRTAVPASGNIVLWGGHTAAYKYGVTDDALQIFDTNVMMINHIVNRFQRVWESSIDKPMTVQMKDEILNREQDYLNALVAQGALIGSPRVEFQPGDNSTVDMVNGNFTFRHIATPTPQLKSATAIVSYTDEGFSVYTD